MKSIKFLLAALLVIAGLAPAGMAASYSNASLKGTCVWQSLFYPTTSGSAANAGPVSVVAPLIFDGQGNVMINYAANVNGTFTDAPNASGTYQVDPNGHGTLTYTSPATGAVIVYDFFITPRGHAIRTMLRMFAGAAVAPRIGNGICRFDQ